MSMSSWRMNLRHFWICRLSIASLGVISTAQTANCELQCLTDDLWLPGLEQWSQTCSWSPRELSHLVHSSSDSKDGFGSELLPYPFPSCNARKSPTLTAVPWVVFPISVQFPELFESAKRTLYLWQALAVYCLTHDLAKEMGWNLQVLNTLLDQHTLESRRKLYVHHLLPICKPDWKLSYETPLRQLLILGVQSTSNCHTVLLSSTSFQQHMDLKCLAHWNLNA